MLLSNLIFFSVDLVKLSEVHSPLAEMADGMSPDGKIGSPLTLHIVEPVVRWAKQELDIHGWEQLAERQVPIGICYE
jgi:hypothetical protein